MRKVIGYLSDLGSLILAGMIIVFFGYFPNYTPPGDNGVLIGVGVTLVIAVIYGILEYLTVVQADTVSPLYFAYETEISHFPVYAFIVIGTWWGSGLITLSFFQWIAAAILIVPIVLDIIGFVSLLAQRYLLTDELKTVK